MLVAVLLLAGLACSGGTTRSVLVEDSMGIRIGSFDFAESELLAELYAQALESEGLPVVRLGVIGPREISAPALEGGLVDLLPEYLGTASQYYGAGPEVDITSLLKSRGLRMLTPAPAENVNVFVVTSETAIGHGLTKLSDLALLAPSFRFGGPAECSDRPLCLKGLSDVYGLTFAEFVPLRNLTLTAEALRHEEVEIGLMFSTASELLSGPFVVLEDDLGLQPAENIVPVLLIDAIDRWGTTLVTRLNTVSRELTTADLLELNRSVAGGMSVQDAAASWLPPKDGA